MVLKLKIGGCNESRELYAKIMKGNPKVQVPMVSILPDMTLESIYISHNLMKKLIACDLLIQKSIIL